MNNFFKIYTGDYSQDGYDDGISDAKTKKQKSGFWVFKAVHPLNYVWKFHNSYDSYNKNYKKGYLDGQRVNHDIYNSNQQRGVNMLDKDRYENHLRMLNEVRQNLIALKRYLNERRVEYKQQINVAGNAGFVQNIVNELDTKYQNFSEKIDNLISLLDKHDTYIQKQEANIQRLIAAAQQTN
jgi:hypothetical protein